MMAPGDMAALLRDAAKAARSGETSKAAALTAVAREMRLLREHVAAQIGAGREQPEA